MSETLTPPSVASPQSGTSVLALTAVFVVVTGLLDSMLLPALPVIQAALTLTTAEGALLLSSIAITASLAVPLVGSLADRYGGRRMLLAVGCAGVAGASLSALTQSFPLLIAALAIQGIGTAVLPLGFVIVRENFPEQKRSFGIGLLVGLFSFGGGVGVVLAGPIAENLSWRWIFGLPAIVIGTATLIAYWIMPRTAPSPGGAALDGTAGKSPDTSADSIDWTGAALLAATLFCLTFALSKVSDWGWSSPLVLGLFAAFPALGALWVRVELRVENPIVNVRFLRRPAVLSGTLAALVLGLGYAVSVLSIPQIVLAPEQSGYGLGGTITDTGLYMLPAALVSVLVGPLAGLLCRRLGSRTVLTAGLVIATAALVFAAYRHSEPWHLILLVVLLGVGAAMSGTALYNGTVESVEPKDTGAATGINFIARSVGILLGVQIAAAIISRYAEGSPIPVPTDASYTNTFLAGGAITALAILLAWRVPGRGTATSPRPTTEPAPTIHA
ncbi:MFS transporter [Streptomyces sp. NPDC056716]|uniref:MFS transporter n=1 Tax=unclassified Streptomyces TaxID=2593676 RepID=UPI0036B6078B